MSDEPKSIRGLSKGERAALLISECQNRHTDPAFGRGGAAIEAERRGIVPKISNLARACRAAGAPVLIAMHTPRPGYVGMKTNCALLANVKRDGSLYEGSESAKLNPLLEVDEGDWIFRRRQGLTDFSGSELDQVLRNLGVETVILAGVSTNIGVLGNVIDVVNRGWTPVLAEDCTAGAPAEHHDYLMRTTYPLICTMSNSVEIIAALRARTT